MEKPLLWALYQEHKKEVGRRQAPNEKLLFHGVQPRILALPHLKLADFSQVDIPVVCYKTVNCGCFPSPDRACAFATPAKS